LYVEDEVGHKVALRQQYLTARVATHDVVTFTEEILIIFESVLAGEGGENDECDWQHIIL